jgi:hypothetical protein
MLLFNPSAQNGPWSLTNSTIGIRAWGARYLGIHKVFSRRMMLKIDFGFNFRNSLQVSFQGAISPSLTIGLG